MKHTKAAVTSYPVADSNKNRRSHGSFSDELLVNLNFTPFWKLPPGRSTL
jgi:hypothetical protein